MSKIQTYINYIADSRARRSIRSLFSKFLNDDEPTTFKSITMGSTATLDISKDKLKIGGTAVTTTATEINTLDGITASTTELNKLDGVTATTTELNLLDGVTATTTELNLLDGVTATTTELNLLDGVTATTTELNILDGVTATAAEINHLDGITASVTELNTLDGITASTTELNKLDGVTANTTELNYLDGAAGAVVAGVAAGYKIARGSVKLDGTNPTPVAHGLNTVVAHLVSIDSTVAPNDPSVVSSAVTGSTLNIYAWKPTSASTTTLVASTVTTVNVEWIAVGT